VAVREAQKLVEAHIRPQDINHVREESAADVRLTSFDARTTPLLAPEEPVKLGGDGASFEWLMAHASEVEDGVVLDFAAQRERVSG
jgi:hypothetical protein